MRKSLCNSCLRIYWVAPQVLLFALASLFLSFYSQLRRKKIPRSNSCKPYRYFFLAIYSSIYDLSISTIVCKSDNKDLIKFINTWVVAFHINHCTICLSFCPKFAMTTMYDITHETSQNYYVVLVSRAKNYCLGEPQGAIWHHSGDSQIECNSTVIIIIIVLHQKFKFTISESYHTILLCSIL